MDWNSFILLMFEFHGWITLRVDDSDDADIEVLRAREKSALEQLNAAIREYSDDISLIETRRTSNDLLVLVTHGLRNHAYAGVVHLYKWVAENLPQSYGILYVHDDEHPLHDNEFRVFKVAQGRLS
ncbi:MAG: Imm7 family immunity protein, partial [Deltaproteobacteria bacterium]